MRGGLLMRRKEADIMMSRRTFAGMLASCTGVSTMGCASAITRGSSSSARQGIIALYRSVGEELHHLDVDVGSSD